MSAASSSTYAIQSASLIERLANRVLYAALDATFVLNLLDDERLVQPPIEFYRNLVIRLAAIGEAHGEK